MNIRNPWALGSALVLTSSCLTGCEMPYQITSKAPAVQAPSSAATSNTASVTVSASATPVASPASTPNSDICITNPTAAACSKAPAVTSAGIVTILFTMSQIPQKSATLILANAIKYASPLSNPKILFLKDSATNGEDEGDPLFIKNTLLLGYNLDYAQIPQGGLDPALLAGKDLVIVSNPGYPLSDAKTLVTLKNFTGGVILIGDDMAQGTETITGLKFQDNGSSMSCGGKSYSYDNGQGYSYQIAMNSEFMGGIPVEFQNYTYGNDLDITTANSGTQVLAWASAQAGTCDIGRVPAVVRRPK